MACKFRDIRSTLRLTTAPVVEPLTAAELRAHCRIDDTFEDAELEVFISSVRELLEKQRNCALISQTWTLKMDAFPDWEIELRRCPVLAITSVSYVDSDGTTQTLATSKYQLSTGSYPALLTPSYGNVWPTTRDQMDAVTVVFTAGYGTTPASVPTAAKLAIRMAGHDMDAIRGSVTKGEMVQLPLGFDRMIQVVGWEGYA